MFDAVFTLCLTLFSRCFDAVLTLFEAVAGAHPDGMLAHAKAGLPVHSGDAEASLVESIRASPATDFDKVTLIRDMPLSPQRKLDLLREMEVCYFMTFTT